MSNDTHTQRKFFEKYGSSLVVSTTFSTRVCILLRMTRTCGTEDCRRCSTEHQRYTLRQGCTNPGRRATKFRMVVPKISV